MSASPYVLPIVPMNHKEVGIRSFLNKSVPDWQAKSPGQLQAAIQALKAEGKVIGLVLRQSSRQPYAYIGNCYYGSVIIPR